MTREDKQLLITDLCARLPYGVKGRDRFFDEKDMTSVITGITYDDTCDTYLVHYDDGNVSVLSDIDEFKPILFPLSAINQEIEVNGEKVILTDFYICINRINGGLETFICSYIPIDAICNYIDIFHRYHIDYRGLIDKGLAISVFDLHENPYKQQKIYKNSLW